MGAWRPGGGGSSGPALGSATPAPLGTAASGSSGDASRADHVHAHGDLAGGTLHGAATTGAAGFMSPTDKTKLDGLSAAGEYIPFQFQASGNGTEVFVSASSFGGRTLRTTDQIIYAVTQFDGCINISYALAMGASNGYVKATVGWLNGTQIMMWVYRATP